MSLLFRQLFESTSSTYTYLVADSKSKEAVIVDSVIETMDRDIQIISELDLKLCWLLETHIHADHVTASGPLKEKLGGKIGAGKGTQLATADQLFSDGDTISFGEFQIKVILTPGHTDGCTSYFVNDRVFTGDALMIRGCGRTDFQQGSSETLFHSVREKLFTLPEETLVFPGHDYKGRTCSSIAEEKIHNPRLKLKNTKEHFVQIMNDLKLDPPKKIDIAVPANMKSGL